MSATIPDREATDLAFGLAVRAPSVHNTQPWRWRSADSGIQLFADTGRQLIVTDPSLRSLIVSCGAALHHMRAALQVSARGAAVRQVPGTLLPRLATPMQHALAAHATNRLYQEEIAHWSGRDRLTDGVPSRNAPAARPDGEIPVRTFADPALLDPRRAGRTPRNGSSSAPPATTGEPNCGQGRRRARFC